jgi:signal recognition particle receptor subunit beta
VTRVRKASYPLSRRSDETVERIRRQRSIDPAVLVGQICVVVLCTQHDLQRSRPPHEARKVLTRAAAMDQSKCRLHLAEDC